MKTLYVECSMGAAGDMLMAALLELYPKQDEFMKMINGLGLHGVEVIREKISRCGILGTHMKVSIHGVEEEAEGGGEHLYKHGHKYNHTHGSEIGHEHTHNQGSEDETEHGCTHQYGGGIETADEHLHNHEHGDVTEHGHLHHHEEESGKKHYHASLGEIKKLIYELDIPEKVREDAVSVYGLIAEAESAVHGKRVEEIHFHEVGAMDAVADIVGVCFLLRELEVKRVVVSPINVGHGHVHCAHGILPVPAPATAHLLRNAPIYGGMYASEMCTPTGAALLQYFVTEFSDMPVMVIEKVGYGMGKKEFEQANCVRIFYGESEDNPCVRERVAELSCNLDDMTGEQIGFATERLWENGALDVFITPIQMKKNRPGQILTCLCAEENADKMAEIFLKYTTTWGVRKNVCERYLLEKEIETADTKYGKIRIKKGIGYGIVKSKPEYEDITQAAKANQCSLHDIYKEL